MKVVIQITADEEKMPFRILGDVGIIIYVVFEFYIAIFICDLFYSMVFFSSPHVIDIAFVISRRGNCQFGKVGINEHGRGRHEPPARMSIDSNSVDVDERISVGELIDGHKSPVSELARQTSTLRMPRLVRVKYNLSDLESSLAMANFL